MNDLVPFIRMGTYEAGCQFGRDKHAKEKKLRTEIHERELESDHPVPKRRKIMLQGSKKKGCKAAMLVKEVVLFPQYKASIDNKNAKDRCRKSLQTALRNNIAVEAVHRLYIKLPDADSHNHTMSPLIGMTNPISDEVKEKIMSLVMVGVSSVAEMRRHLREFVRGISPAPLQTNLAYYPMDNTIRRHMYTCQQRLRYSKLDQENVIKYVAEYATSNPADNITFIPATSDSQQYAVVEIAQDDEDEVISTTSKPISTSFFFCHQSCAQRQLLRRYGNDICLLDATYRTTKYALPLFFLAVPTNVGYMVVGEFIVENESSASIKQGLQTLKQWMMEDLRDEWEWNPRLFMTDFCEAEIIALQETFTETRVILCDFHREQSWSRWLSKSSNGLSAKKEQVTVLLRRCAHTIDQNEFDRALSQLQLSSVWRENLKLRNWFTRKWIPEKLRWVWAFRLDRRVMVNTNNGLERQNKDFKYTYLEQKKSNSLAGMINVLLTEYLPSRMMRYMRDNVVASQLFGRLYYGNIPDFLQDRPQSFVRHCMDKLQLAQYIEEDEIEVHGQCYKVRSQSDGGRHHDVLMDNGNGQPQCTCRVWIWERMPCKHMFAVIQHHSSWNSLPLEFRASPFFTLDDNVLSISPSIDESTLNNFENNTEPAITDLPVAEKRHKCQVNKFAVQCREQISLIRTNTYLCRDEQVLQSVHRQLKEASDFILKHLKSDCETGLIEEEIVQPKTRKSRKRLIRKKQSQGTEKAKSTIIEVPHLAAKTQHRATEAQYHTTNIQSEKPSKEYIKAKALEFKENLSEKEWRRMLHMAQLTKSLTLDEVCETAYSVLKHLEDDGLTLLTDLQVLAPSMSQSGMFRLANMVICQLAKQGKVAANYDVQRRREEMQSAMRQLVDALASDTECQSSPEKEHPVKSNVPKSVLREKNNNTTRKSVSFAQGFETCYQQRHTSKKGTTGAITFCGLPNPPRKNICFANSLLQSMKTTDVEEILKCHKQCETPCLICELKFFYEEYPSLSSLRICFKMEGVWPAYQVGTEEDVHEMFQLLMDKIKSLTELTDIYRHTFEGEMESSVTCGHCGARSTNIEIYNHLSLSLKNAITLAQSLYNFFAEELIKEYKCQSCLKYGSSTKKFRIRKLPVNLTVHLKRFAVVNERRKKDYRNVHLDEDIHLKSYVKDELKEVLEHKGKLTAAVIHEGSLHSGHYFCLARAGLEWFRIDDTKVRKVKMTNEMIGDAYLLIYKMMQRPYIS